MTTKSRLYLGVAALAIAVVLTGSVVEVSAQQSAPAAVAIDNRGNHRSSDPLRQDGGHR